MLHGREACIPSHPSLSRDGSLPHRQRPGFILRQMPDELATVIQARSMLILLLATCQQTLLALEAAANVLDTDLTTDLRSMIKRSEDELETMSAKIKDLAG